MLLTFRSLGLHLLLTVTGQGVLLCKALNEQFCHSPGFRKISRDYEEFALSCDGTDWCDAAMVDFMEAENAEMLADEELRKLYAAMRKLTERQQEVVQLYFYKGLNQYEIADELGIARRSVGDCLEGALKKIRKNF